MTDVVAWKAALPTPRHEDWKYTSLAPVKAADVRPIAFAPTITATGASVETRSGEATANDVVVSVDEVVHVLVNDGAEAVVTIVHDTPAGALTGAAVFVHVPANASVRVTERFVGQDVFVHVPATTFAIATGGKARYVRVVEAAPKGFHLGTVTADLAADASLTLASLVFGCKVARVGLDVKLARGAVVEMDGLSLTGKDALIDHHTFVDHAEPHATTRERFRAAVDSGGRAVFTGKVLVREGADKTDASQHTKTLLLADDAIANARPQLEILADDVKCAHGAAVGRLDDEAVFYLQSRGIGPDDARRLLTKAFASESLAAIDDDALRGSLDALVDQWLARLS